MGLIAGHRFGMDGFCELLIDDVLCRRKFCDISSATRANLNQKGWAHRGDLNETELSEIEAEKERLYAAHKGQRGQ